MKVTHNELVVLKAIADSDYVDLPYSDKSLIDFPTWIFDVKHYSKLDGLVFSGTCSSLTQKGWIKSDKDTDNADGDDRTISMTEAGFKALNN